VIAHRLLLQERAMSECCKESVGVCSLKAGCFGGLKSHEINLENNRVKP
jgi:hypothetical protein